MRQQVPCPHCGSYHTYPHGKHMPFMLALIIGVVTLGLGFFITIPWWLLEKFIRNNDPYYHHDATIVATVPTNGCITLKTFEEFSKKTILWPKRPNYGVSHVGEKQKSSRGVKGMDRISVTQSAGSQRDFKLDFLLFSVLACTTNKMCMYQRMPY